MTNPKFKIGDKTMLSKIKETYTKLVDYLKEIMFQKGILERPSYMELSKKLDFTYNWIKDKKDTLKSHSPKKETFDDLYTRLSEKYKELLKNAWKTIEIKFQNLYDLTFPTDSNLPSAPSLAEKSIKRKFFDDIKDIIIKYFPKARIFDTDISRLFFKRARTLKDSHIKGNYELRKFTKSTIFSFIYKIRFLTTHEFIQKVRDIKKVDQATFDNIKNEIENFIEHFIFSNPFDEKYIYDQKNIGSAYYKPEFDLSFDIWFEFSKIRKAPQQLKHVRKLVGYDSLGRLTRGYIYSWDGLMNMLKKLITLIHGEVYSTIFEQAWKYIKHRNLYPALPRVYHPSWNTESTVKFHVIILLIRDLGLDILNLEPIDPKAFKKTNIMESFTFERHHIFINDKFSIDGNRLVLVMRMNHSALEGKTDLLLDLIQSRKNLTLECPQYYKTHVKRWKKLWHQYVERRYYLIENGIESFINKYFMNKHGHNFIIERFFKKVPKGKIEEEIKTMMQEWIEKGRPAPILNPYVLNRLFLGAPYLLNSGFIGD